MQAFVATGSSTFILQFCPYPQNFSNCMNVTSVTSNAQGAVNANFTFPAKGTFSGAFQIVDANGVQSEAAGNGSTGVSFKSALLPAATVTGGINQTTGNSPGFGSASRDWNHCSYHADRRIAQPYFQYRLVQLVRGAMRHPGQYYD